MEFFGTLHKAGGVLAVAWWILAVVGGVLPVAFSVAVGALVSAIHTGAPIRQQAWVLGVVLVLSLTQAPIFSQVSANLGDRLAMRLHGRLLDASTSPAGVAHLESHDDIGDLVAARDFDTGMAGPKMSLSLSIISGGLVKLVTGCIFVLLLFGYRWWAPLLLGGAWASTHWLLHKSTVWDRTEGVVRTSQRHAEYAYGLGVSGAAAKELRMFAMSDWLADRFRTHRRALVNLRLADTRLRRAPLATALLILLTANGLTFWSIARDASAGHIGVGAVAVFGQAAIGASLIAFGGPNWALSLASGNVAALLRVERGMVATGDLPDGSADASGLPIREIRFRDVHFAYPGGGRPVLTGFNLTIPAGSSVAVVGLNGEGKTTLLKLLCRFYDPTSGAIEVDGQDIRTFNIDSWRRRIAAVFQDFARYELPLRDNVAPLGAPDETILAALADAGAEDLRGLDTVLAAGYDGGTELSGGQWQRVAIARALTTVRLGAGVVILDEPTAQLDVRGELEIFDRVLAATRECTTLLVSHRFATVRHADRICVLSGGRCVELGSHDELMALGGQYRVMFDLQAQRFEETSDGVLG